MENYPLIIPATPSIWSTGMGLRSSVTVSSVGHCISPSILVCFM